MSVQELEAEALKLPANERIRLAQELWDSIVPEAENNPDLLPLEPVAVTPGCHCRRESRGASGGPAAELRRSATII